MTDTLTEMLVGEEGAIRMPAKLVLRPFPEYDGLTQIGLWGSGASSFGWLGLKENREKLEMWAGEIILIPMRKYSGTRPDGSTAFGGMRADQMLCQGFERPEMWGPEYWKAVGLRG